MTMNQYLEKIASSAGYFAHLTGKALKNHTIKVRHVQEFLANGETLKGLHSTTQDLLVSKAKARLQAAGAGAIAATGGAIAYKATRKYQDAQYEKEFQRFQKQASAIGLGKAVASTVMKGVSKAAPVAAAVVKGTAKKVGKVVSNVGSHITGSHIATYANNKGVAVGSVSYNRLKNAVRKDFPVKTQAKILSQGAARAGAPLDAKQTLKDLSSLNRKRNAARIGSVAAVGYGVKKYVDHKNDPDNLADQYNYR